MDGVHLLRGWQIIVVEHPTHHDIVEGSDYLNLALPEQRPCVS